MPARQWVMLVVLNVLCLAADAQVMEFPPVNTFVGGDPNVTGLAVIDDGVAYFYWNERMVTVPAITVVELDSGRHLWSKPAKLDSRFVLPRTFQVEGEWLLYETVDEGVEDPRSVRLSQRILHLVNGQTGEEQILPRADSTRRSFMSRPMVRRDHCVTYDGTVVRCTDGHIIGDLGTGDHHAIVDDDHLFVTTSTAGWVKAADTKRFVRKFDLTTMRLLLELDLPLQTFSQMIAAKDSVAVFAGESGDERQLFCVDLTNRSEQWRTAFPYELSFACQWDADNQLVLYHSTHTIVRPIRLNVANGHLAADRDWMDPRSLLGWYQSRTETPDFVAANRKFVVGRWQQQQVICVDPSSGQLLWKHLDSDDCVGRLFTDRMRLGEYFVAATYDRFNIVSVATGETHSIRPADVGLTAASRLRTSASDIDVTPEPSYFTSTKFDRVRDGLLLATPLSPLIIWLMWRFFRRRATAGNAGNPNPR